MEAATAADTAAQIVEDATYKRAPLADLCERALRGPLAAGGLTVRDGQVRGVRAIADAIEERGPTTLAIEAPTGSGKGLMALLPAVLHLLYTRKHHTEAEPLPRRVVYSTAGIPLQRQLVEKDVPMLARLLGIPATAGALVGRQNYACLEQVADARKEADGRGLSPGLSQITGWLASAAAASGRKDDATFAIDHRDWNRISVGREDCIGPKCDYVRQCYSERAKARALGAWVLVVNHHYLALSGNKLAEGSALLVVDEAHDLPDTLRSARAIRLGENSPEVWERRIGKYDHAGAYVVGSAVRSIMAEAIQLRKASGDGREPKVRLRKAWFETESPRAMGGRIEEIGEGLVAAATSLQTPDKEKLERLAEQVIDLSQRTRRITEAWEDHCVWVELDQGRHVVQCAPIEPKGPSGWKASAYLSATLAVNGSPARALAPLGVEAAELSLPSPWPLAEMGVVVIPRGPLPNEGGWEPWADRATSEFTNQLGGGVLVLCTSLARGRRLATHLRQATQWDVREQGEAGRAELAAWLRGHGNGVLVASRSFFQGIDIQGDALRGVVLDRVPFPVPGEPLEDAICAAIAARKGDPFRERSLPQACALLRQAAGRLLRSSTDRGAVLLTDPRVHTARWGGTVLRAFSPLPVSIDLNDAGRLWRGERIAAAPNHLPGAPLPPARRLVRRPAPEAVSPDQLALVPGVEQAR